MSSNESPTYRHASGTSNDLSAGILVTIDVGSDRVEKRKVMKIALADYDGALDPIPTSAPGHAAEPELNRLSNIMRAFTHQSGNID
jgi:type I restriction enzyme R subunit